LIAFVAFVDRTNERIGRVVSWLTLGMVLLQFAIVVLRYVFGAGWIAAQEAVVYMHAAVFLGAAGYTLRHDGHVRVDIFYGPAGPRARAWVDMLGALVLLLPMSAALFWLAWPYVAASWAVLEGSPEGQNGIPAIFLLKSLILVFAVLVGLQGLALAARSLAVVRGHVEAAPEHEEGGHGV